jgi:hypothetical protein
MLSSVSPLTTNLSFGNRETHTELYLGNGDNSLEITAQTKQSSQKPCHGGGTNLQCTISQDIYAAHLAIYIA